MEIFIVEVGALYLWKRKMRITVQCKRGAPSTDFPMSRMFKIGGTRQKAFFMDQYQSSSVRSGS